jgi:hypothetical protein
LFDLSRTGESELFEEHLGSALPFAITALSDRPRTSGSRKEARVTFAAVEEAQVEV